MRLLVGSSVMSSVNLAEVQTRLVRDGVPAGKAEEIVRQVMPRVADFDEGMAVETGSMIQETGRHISLGDRACLVLARRMNLPVYTGDRAWQELHVGVEIRLLR